MFNEGRFCSLRMQLKPSIHDIIWVDARRTQYRRGE